MVTARYPRAPVVRCRDGIGGNSTASGSSSKPSMCERWAEEVRRDQHDRYELQQVTSATSGTRTRIRARSWSRTDIPVGPGTVRDRPRPGRLREDRHGQWAYSGLGAKYKCYENKWFILRKSSASYKAFLHQVVIYGALLIPLNGTQFTIQDNTKLHGVKVIGFRRRARRLEPTDSRDACS